MASNYDDVLGQLRGVGLIVDSLQVGGRMVRCKVEGAREKRGWYTLHELQLTGGEVLLVGSYGVWRGNDNGATKIELRKRELTPEQRESIRKRLAEDRRRVDADRKAEAERAAVRAAKAWAKCDAQGDCDYLVRKGVQAHGLRFSPSGTALVPMLDTSGKIHGLQIIRSSEQLKKRRGLPKEYWPKGLSTKGHFHLIGIPAWIVLIAEGYATGATLHEATGLPVAIAFDANNMPAVAAALKKRYPGARALLCADDDTLAKCRECREPVILSLHTESCPHCYHPHLCRNAGVEAASAAAIEVEGGWVAPKFANADARHSAFEKRGHKLTDFNDLHQLEGLHVVRTQVETRILELGWSSPARAVSNNNGGEGAAALRPIATLDELLDRFALVYGKGGTVFDRWEHTLVSLSDMRDACMSKYIHRAWSEHPNRCLVREREVGFDPGNEDPLVTCNLWAGWPTKPQAGRCERLLDLLRYMCSEETDSEELYQWVLCWIAYPIQHPGAKMKTTVVLHGPQGTGKNLFFEALMSIYDKYGRVIDQAAIEDKFNDWASRKLFLIADEVVARSDLYHIKNKLKAFITGDWIRINPKQIQAYDERNHVNVVFLSNEAMPVVLEEDDRRHTVIWTPKKLTADFYVEVRREIAEGGVAALHDYLLHVDLSKFGPATLPPVTQAKRQLINLGLDSTSRFFYEIESGELNVPLMPALSTDVYSLYKAWSARNGLRAAPLPKLINALDRKHDVRSARKRYITHTGGIAGPHGLLMFGGSECPPGKSEPAWLGESIETFRTASRDYAGSSYG